MKKKNNSEREFDFALVVAGVPRLTTKVEDALFEAGCDDATLSMQHGLLYVEFSRAAESVADAILSAIQNVRSAGIGADVIRVDDCDLVTPAEIARRMGRSRQLVFQYISGERGPGGFPPPECHLTGNRPLWAWCSVSHWLMENNLLRKEDNWNAQVTNAINVSLEAARQKERNPDLVKQIENELELVG